MGDGRRWFVVLVVAVLLVGLISFARGRDHHRGDDVGARGRFIATISSEEWRDLHE